MNVLGVRPMQLVAWYVPNGLAGVLLALFGGLFLHKLSAKAMMAATGLAIIVESLMLALAPADANYWQWIFIPMLCSSVAIEFVFNFSSVYFSTCLPARQQGIAGALSNVLLHLGTALMLGVGEIIATHTLSQCLHASYRNVFWFNMACGATALLIFVGFVHIDTGKGDSTVEEKGGLEQERV